MGDAIREKSDEDKDPREEPLLQYQEQTQLEIQDIQLEAGMPQDTADQNLCKHTQNEPKLLVTPAKQMGYINWAATKMTVCIYNAQNSLIIESGAQCSIVAIEYMDSHFPNLEEKVFPTKVKKSKSASGKMTSIGKIIKEIIIPHRKGNIRLNTEFVVLEHANIQVFLPEKTNRGFMALIFTIVKTGTLP
ncbi:hypothetical protein O181_010452 [Austropuccinia psidii MF-1]|uniref:Uncharacterized protein n=1 Tax=Austropuccinia psidii MF-1 TaxID=1389203 RepID=A0A9Q3BSN0_9BASI|nr:hypothetical protein [Austropuccinia psidii MF-1]